MTPRAALITVFILLAILVASIFLAGCAPFKVEDREGPVEKGSREQLLVQCKEQPSLKWCQPAVPDAK